MSKEPRLVDQRVRYALIRKALPTKPARICEVGVGHGWLLQCLQDEGYDVHGCDKNLKDLPTELSCRNRVLQTTGGPLPFPDNDFDCTYSCDVLEHVDPAERDLFLNELIRVTKPGGVVALTAFFRNTISFRLWGVGYLFLRGTLPSWYTEHLTIPLPNEEATFAHLSYRLTDVCRIRYQRCLNLFIMWLQCVAPTQRYVASVFAMARFLIPDYDVFGRTTSVFFAGVKPK